MHVTDSSSSVGVAFSPLWLVLFLTEQLIAAGQRSLLSTVVLYFAVDVDKTAEKRSQRKKYAHLVRHIIISGNFLQLCVCTSISMKSVTVNIFRASRYGQYNDAILFFCNISRLST